MSDWTCLDCGSSNPLSNAICGSVACQERRSRNLPQPPATPTRKSRTASATTPASLRITDVAGKTLDLELDPKTSTKTEHSYPAEFEVFWDVYPRHKDKLAALKAWKRATLRVSPAVLLDGAERYRNDPQRKAREVQYTKHAATWLNAGGWEDEADEVAEPQPLSATDWEAMRADDDARIAAMLQAEQAEAQPA